MNMIKEKKIVTKSSTHVLISPEKRHKNPIGDDVNVEDDIVSDAGVNNSNNNSILMEDSINKEQPSRVSGVQLNRSFN